MGKGSANVQKKETHCERRTGTSKNQLGREEEGKNKEKLERGKPVSGELMKTNS